MNGEWRWSYSALSAYLHQCTLKFFFRYVARIEPERTSSKPLFGSAVHAALEAAYRTWKRGQEVPLALAQETFEADLLIRVQDPLLEFKKGETPEGLVREGKTLLETWAKQARFEEVIAVESDFVVPVEHPKTGEVLDRELSGRVDLLVKDPESGDPVVVDFKTSGRRFSLGKLDDDLQPSVYAYAMRHMNGSRTVSLRWDVLVRTKKPQVQTIEMARGPTDDLRLFRLIMAAERGVQSQAFWPSDSSMWCGSCSFRVACSRWQDNPDAFRSESASQLAWTV